MVIRSPSSRSDLTDIMQYIKDCGIKYVRPTTTTNDFKLPTDWYNWSPTCHHDDIGLFLERFMELEPDGELDLMAVWGHSFELADTYKPDETKLRWDGMQELASILKDDDTIWKATNGDIYNYIEATKLIEIDYDADTITNNSFFSMKQFEVQALFH